MVRMAQSLRVWGTSEFAEVFKSELAGQAAQLPLQQGLASSSSVADAPVGVMVISVADVGNAIRVKAGIFYQGLVGGCSCAGDPTPDSENAEYCVVMVEIDRLTAVAAVSLLPETC